MSELTTMTAADLSAALASKDVSATEVAQAHLDRIAAVDGRVHAFLHVAVEEALAAAERVDEQRAAGVQLGPLAGVPVALKDVFTTTDMPTTAGLPDHRKVAAAVRRDDHQPPAPRRGHHPRQDQHGRVRHGLLDRELRVRPDPQPVGPVPGARRVVGWLGRVGGCVRGAAGHRHGHRRVDPPARSGLRHYRDEAYLRRQLPVRADRVRVLARHARPAGPHGAGRGAAARGHLGARPDGRHVYQRGGAAGRGRGPPGGRGRRADRRGHRTLRRGLPAGRAVALQPGDRAARVPRRQGHRGVLPALPLRAARVLPDRAQRVLLQPGPLRRDALWPASRRRRHPQRGRGHGADPRGGVRGRGEAAHHARHVRAVQRVLRRLLRQGAAGADAGRARLRGGVRPGGRAGLADHADDRVPAGGAGRRPDGHVPGRPVHHPVQPGRERGHLGAVRAGTRGRPAGRAAGHDARAGRRPGLPGRRRGGGRVHRALGPSTAGRGQGTGRRHEGAGRSPRRRH